MTLVDTSVWIEFFRFGSQFELERFAQLDEVLTCLPVVQEVLQGYQDPKLYGVARRSLLSFPILESPLSKDVFVEAADLYRTARKNGYTVRSSVDCLIAACAVRNAVPVLHCDRDFVFLAKVSSLEQTDVLPYLKSLNNSKA